jgi:hypothetical protein
VLPLWCPPVCPCGVPPGASTPPYVTALFCVQEVLRATLERKEKQLGEVQGALSAANSDILNFQNLVEFKSKQVEDLQQQLQAQEQKHLSTVGRLEQEVCVMR